MGYIKGKNFYSFPMDIWVLKKLINSGLRASQELLNLMTDYLVHLSELEIKKHNNYKSNICIESNKKIDNALKDYQRQAVEYMALAEKCILGDDMGLGKSISALGLIELIDAKKTIIISPSYVKYNWMIEVEKWTDLNIFLCVGNKKQREIVINEFNTSNERGVLIVNYEMCTQIETESTNKRGKKVLKKENKFNFLKEFDCIILDECHRLTRKVSYKPTISELKSKYIIGMTGTIINKHCIELWSFLNLLDKDRFSSYWRFAEYFFEVSMNRYGGFDIGNLRREKEYKNLLNEFMLRREKSDVLELPAKIIHEVQISLSSKHMKCYKALFSYKLGDGSFIESDLELFIRLGQCVYSPKLVGFKETGSFFDDIIGLYEDISQNERVIIAFDSKIACIEFYKYIITKLKKLQIFNITGDTDVERRHELLQRFEKYENSILICTIRSLAEGISMDYCNKMILSDISFSNNKNVQFYDRIHRMTSTVKKEYYHIVVNNTCQSYKYRRLKNEAKNIKGIVDGDLESIIAAEYLESIRRSDND